MKKQRHIIITKNGQRRVSPCERNHYRKKILEENLLDCIEQVKASDRTKEIVKEYMSGKSYKETGEKFGITASAVSGAVCRYIHNANIYKKSIS